jgi:beta-glucosidase
MSATHLNTDDRARALLAQLTLDEKMSLLAGQSFWKTRAVPRLSLAPMRVTDGPRGVSYHSAWRRCTAFPTGIALGASWDPELAREFGEALARETAAVGARVILGPAVNICRTPLNGRTFEYFTEDPELNARLAVACVKGIQSQGVAACIKHYAANSQEANRTRNSSQVSERALREIYLPAFEAAVREGDVWAVMAAYNAVNGVAACENGELLTGKLRREYGFRGFVVSDWFAARRTSSAASAIRAGLNLEMPGKGSKFRTANLRKEFAAGAFSEAELDDCLEPLLRIWLRTQAAQLPPGQLQRNTPEHQRLARRMAAESITLLKNEGNVLPLERSRIRRLAVLGPRAKKRNCLPLLGGSAGVWPPHEITPLQGLKEFLGEDCEIVRDPARADAAIVFAGLGHGFRRGRDTEGMDRTHMALPPAQQRLIRETAAKNPNTVVVLVSGSPLEMDWAGEVPAIVMAWYPGMEGGRAIADVLFGACNPSGKLPVTFARSLSDCPAHRHERQFPGSETEVLYEEDIFVGYRHFDRESIEPLYPFGFGLSYTRFSFTDLSVPASWPAGEKLQVSMTLTNDGPREGAEVVQLYVGACTPTLPRPVRELRAFRKVRLGVGESHRVSFELEPAALAHYCENDKAWRSDPGDYELSLGSSSRDIHLRACIRYGCSARPRIGRHACAE